MDDAARKKLAENLASVRARIAAACTRAKRDPDEVTLIAVTKTVGPETIQALIDLGVRDIGENKLQAAEEKFHQVPALKGRKSGEGNVRTHFIGHLQSNKVRGVLELFDWIHSVDSVKLAQEIDKRAIQSGLERTRCLLELNLADEPTKSGIRFSSADLASFHGRDIAASIAAKLLKEFLLPQFYMDVAGLMTMAPAAADPATLRKLFRLMAMISSALSGAVAIPGQKPRLLSMGMSNDFEIAIEEGATHVRIGTALFAGL